MPAMKELQLCNRSPNIAGAARSYRVIIYLITQMLQPETKYSIYQQLVPKNATRRDAIYRVCYPEFDPKSRKGTTIRGAINRVSTVGWLKHLTNQVTY
ncbi:MAG TPA: hypothetical protein VIF37_00820 [Methylobacter sp.]